MNSYKPHKAEMFAYWGLLSNTGTRLSSNISQLVEKDIYKCFCSKQRSEVDL